MKHSRSWKRFRFSLGVPIPPFKSERQLNHGITEPTTHLPCDPLADKAEALDERVALGHDTSGNCGTRISQTSTHLAKSRSTANSNRKLLARRIHLHHANVYWRPLSIPVQVYPLELLGSLTSRNNLKGRQTIRVTDVLTYRNNTSITIANFSLGGKPEENSTVI